MPVIFSGKAIWERANIVAQRCCKLLPLSIPPLRLVSSLINAQGGLNVILGYANCYHAVASLYYGYRSTRAWHPKMDAQSSLEELEVLLKVDASDRDLISVIPGASRPTGTCREQSAAILLRYTVPLTTST